MKKLAALLAIFLTFGVMTNAFAYEDDGSDNPRVIFDNKGDIPSVSAGEKLEMKFNVKNTGGETAKNIVITAEKTNTPISWYTAVDTYNIYRMSSGFSKEINMSFKVNETANVGTYEIPFNISYSDYSGMQYSTKQTLYFKVVEENAKPLLIVRNVKNNPEIVVAGEKSNLSFELFNMGDLTARRVKLTLSGMKKDGFMVEDSIENRYFEEIEGQTSERVNFGLLVSEDIEKGTNELEIKLEYLDESGVSYSDSKKIYINDVQGTTGSNGKGTPKIIISSYNALPKAVTAGDVVEFEFTFKNTNESKTIKNMKVVINSEDGIFNIEEGSNSFYIAELLPQGEMSRKIFLRPKQDTLSRAYPVSINFDYEDTAGNSYSTKELINIQVIERSKLTINNIQGPYEIYQGGTGNISFEYYNMGKATISNLSATVEGDFRAVTETNYIGNIEAGKGSYFDIEVTSDIPGEAKGMLVLSFEDSSGKIIQVKREFISFIYEDAPAFNPGDMGEVPTEQPQIEEKSGMEWWKLTLIGFGAFVVAAFITRAVTIKIMMKRIENEI